MTWNPRGNALRFRTSWTAPNVNGNLAFSSLEASFRRAIASMPQEVSTTRIILAGAEASLNFVGHRLAYSIAEAFQHLIPAQSGGSPHLTMDLWDERATGIACPDVVKGLEQQVKAEREGRLFVTVGGPEDRFVGHLRPGIHVWMDRQAAHAVGWVADSALLSLQDRSKPLHVPLLLWHADRGTPVVHAAMVSWHGRGALLIGGEGTGKTSAAAACFLGGLSFLGDDYVAVQRIDGDGFVGHGLYDSIRLRPDTEARFAEFARHLRPSLRSQSDGKRLVRSTDVDPLQVARSAEIIDIMAIERREGGGIPLTSMSKREAFLSVAPSSMLRLPVSGGIHLERMAELIDRLPVHRLTIDGDLTALPHLMKKRLERGEAQ